MEAEEESLGEARVALRSTRQNAMPGLILLQ
jgi:hypothetical protein